MKDLLACMKFKSSITSYTNSLRSELNLMIPIYKKKFKNVQNWKKDAWKHYKLTKMRKKYTIVFKIITFASF